MLVAVSQELSIWIHFVCWLADHQFVDRLTDGTCFIHLNQRSVFHDRMNWRGSLNVWL